MTFELFCAVLIALIIGVAIAFNGYRWFLILLPIFGFVYGFGLGAQTMQAIFGQEMFATATSWVVGLFIGVIFAVLSYLFYFIGVGIFFAAIGYSVGVGLMVGLFGQDLTFLTWLVGIAAAVGLVFVGFKFNIQKYIIILGTALIGAGLIVASVLFPMGTMAVTDLTKLALLVVLKNNFFWMLVFIALAAGGVYTQIVSTKNFSLEGAKGVME